MRKSSLGFYGKMPLCAALSAAFLFAGCSEDPGLQERLTRLQAEMQEKNRQLQDAQSALEKTKSELKSALAASNGRAKPAESASSAAPQFLPKEQLEENYAAASKTMQQRVSGDLKNYSIENCDLYPVVMPTAAYPYSSKIALTMRADSGHSYRLEFPVSADTSGKWSFPGLSDISGALADSRQKDQSNVAAATPAATPAPTAAAPSQVASNRSNQQPTQQVVPGQASTETRVIDWGDKRSSSGTRQQPPRQQPVVNNSGTVAPQQAAQPTPLPQQPQQNQVPQKAMPSDRDVTIKW